MPLFWKIRPLARDSTSFHSAVVPMVHFALKPALQQDGGDVAESALSCSGPLLFLFLTLVFVFFVFFTITNTKDPVEKTFCFTGNKNIIYASVKCKNFTPLHPAKPGLSGVLRNQQKHTGDFCVFIHHCSERNERTVPTDRTQLLCTTFQVLMNKRWNWQPCLSLLFCPLLPSLHQPHQYWHLPPSSPHLMML